MRRLLAGSGWACFACCFALCGCGRAEEASAPAKYIGTIHRDGIEEEQIFDPSRPAEAEELCRLLRQGAVDSLEKEREFKILAFRWDLGLWTLVVFLLLLLALSRLAWRPMLEMAQQREARIRDALAEAQRARDEAQHLRAGLQKEMDRVQEKVRDILDAARRDAERTTEEMLAKARAEIQAERERLHREIDMARDHALQEIWNQTARVATLVAAKAIRRELNQDDHRRLVDEAIADLRHAGSQRQREVAGVHS